MTPPTHPDVGTIARGLTKAQRYWIKEGSPHGDCSIRTIRALIVKGIWWLRIDSPNGRAGFVEPTALGLALRAHLEQERTK